MKGEAAPICKMFDGANTRFEIPVYQRNYDWRQDECRQLFDDLEAVMQRIDSGDSCSHFFGSIVSKCEYETRIIIDGQQRTTSCMLILAALLHLCENGQIVQTKKATDSVIRDILFDRYMDDEPVESKVRLKLIKADQDAYIAVLKNNPEKFIADSNVTDNYLYFRERIINCRFSAEDVFRAFRSLQIIDILLGDDDDPQLIFESLNSTGLALNEGDKVRNYLLMSLDSKTQQNYYESYWNEIEKDTDFDVSPFIRYYLASVRRKTPPMKNVYPEYKAYVTKQGLSKLDQLIALKRFSSYYKRLRCCEGPSEESSRVLRRLALSDNSVITPFFLNLFDYEALGNLSAVEFAETLKVVENYLFRRWAAQVSANALNKVFETLHNEVVKLLAPEASYPDVLKFVLLGKEGSARFPRDEEFLSSLIERDFYQTQMKFYLFDRLENGDNLERVEVAKNLRNGIFSVEHIMPQTLSARWKEDLGPRYKEIHSAWLNRLGNLTITAYNSEYSNSPFIEKRDCPKGFRQSGLRLNRFIASREKWGVEELEERTEQLRTQFLALWPMIESSFVPAVEPLEEHALSESEADFSGRKIAAFSYKSSRYTVKSWAEMFARVCMAVAAEDPAAFNIRAPECSNLFQSKAEGTNARITDSVWLIHSVPTMTKLFVLRRLFDALQINTDELTFELYKPSRLSVS